LNRLVGSIFSDVEGKVQKTEVARRLLTGVNPNATLRPTVGRWQEHPELLRGCDIVFGCVDTFAERDQLERACRRYLIPYIDIGMDVHTDAGPPRMAGQVILSMPGKPCMWCLNFLTEERLALEAAQYGGPGGRPQVVWPNGVLASTAVGLGMELLTGWTAESTRPWYYSYDGNLGTLTPHIRAKFLDGQDCPHFPLSEVGDPVFKTI
jgi:hypothetical protein